MSIYHQIFYPKTKWQSPNDIQLLESFMYLTKPLEEKTDIQERQLESTINIDDDVICLPNSSSHCVQSRGHLHYKSILLRKPSEAWLHLEIPMQHCSTVLHWNRE